MECIADIVLTQGIMWAYFYMNLQGFMAYGTCRICTVMHFLIRGAHPYPSSPATCCVVFLLCFVFCPSKVFQWQMYVCVHMLLWLALSKPRH